METRKEERKKSGKTWKLHKTSAAVMDKKVLSLSYHCLLIAEAASEKSPDDETGQSSFAVLPD